ncbi:hypothetical protein BP6252_02099 [Coleophoma cylindrospora]|uniref:F-box domain-containing protein n=1 Tax=Coleophoma cylindrospora TaxID=1849047 RepID=A0A3D8SDW7_9HELO|nr:hypothetical protein BP6252_02099 [Coleophoma cylindrospora]
MENIQEAKLSKLSPELLLQIVQHFETAKTLTRLGATCKELKIFVDNIAWREFCAGRFPNSMSLVVDRGIAWKELAHYLTDRSTYLERKAIKAYRIDLEAMLLNGDKAALKYGLGGILGSQTKKDQLQHRVLQRERENLNSRYNRTGPRSRPPFHHLNSLRQTVGTPTVLDCKAEFAGSVTCHEEILAIGAGADIHIRFKKTTKRASQRKEIAGTFQGIDMPEQFRQGKDDITSIKITSWEGMGQNSSSPKCEVIVARTGTVSLVKLGITLKDTTSECHKVAEYVGPSSPDGGQPRISFLSSDAHEGLLAACTGRDVFIYDAQNSKGLVSPISHLRHAGLLEVRSARFLSAQRLVLGSQRTTTPWKIFDITEAKLEEASSLSTQLSTRTTIHAMEPLGAMSTMGGSLPGNIFLSACHDGFCRLIDLRDPSGVVTSYEDHISKDPYYSLALLGEGRFAAGSSKEAQVTFYDMRMGDKAYHYTDALPCSPRPPFPNPPQARAAKTNTLFRCFSDTARCTFVRCHFHEQSRKEIYDPNYRLYLGTKEKWADSPIYSLRSPSVLSTHLYAGVYDNVIDVRINGGWLTNNGPNSEKEATIGMVEVPQHASPRAYVPLQRTLSMSPIWLPNPRLVEGYSQDREDIHRLDVQWHLEKDHTLYREDRRRE